MPQSRQGPARLFTSSRASLSTGTCTGFPCRDLAFADRESTTIFCVLTCVTPQFQKILSHRGIADSNPMGALARLQVGTAFAMAGDTTRAKAAYLDLLAPW